MIFSISNIAWDPEEDSAVYALMRQYGFSGLDIAPMRVLDDPYYASKSVVSSAKAIIREQGFECVGVQSLLYGYPEMQLFQDKSARERTIDCLKRAIHFTSWIGGKVLVFGNPKNRIIGNINKEKKYSIAVDLFRDLGEEARQYDVIFCIEANASAYGTDFINTTIEAFELVQAVDNPGFQLILDTGTLLMNGEDCQKTISQVIGAVAHVHISEPYLNAIPTTESLAVLKNAMTVLQNHGYNRGVAIEMKKSGEDSNIGVVESALNFLSEIRKGWQ